MLRMGSRAGRGRVCRWARPRVPIAWRVGGRRASERDVVGLILGQGLVVSLAGIGLGLAGAVALSRVVSSFLVGVSATDPITFAGVPALLFAIAIVASFVPARRASRVDPNEALRDR